jgi:hypothetical protein
MTDKSLPSWWTLDNAAKIFPSTGSAHDSKVFRFACELQEPVDPKVLQAALDRVIERFPIYRSVIKRGWFWYYLERSPLPARVQAEDLPPCYPIYPAVRRSLLFRVLYYRRRISLEVYHSLTDGTGALNFLCALVYEYLLLHHPDAFPDPPHPCPMMPPGSSSSRTVFKNIMRSLPAAQSAAPPPPVRFREHVCLRIISPFWKAGCRWVRSLPAHGPGVLP